MQHHKNPELFAPHALPSHHPAPTSPDSYRSPPIKSVCEPPVAAGLQRVARAKHLCSQDVIARTPYHQLPYAFNGMMLRMDWLFSGESSICLLYTSDAADE